MHKQSGFTMVELLVSVVITAVGILGVVGLQVISLQQNRSALFRADAVQLSNDIFDRIRANPLTPYSLTLAAAPTGNTSCINSAGCTPAEMAVYDINQWVCSISGSDANDVPYPTCVALGIGGRLPRGDGSIALGPNGVYTVTVQWEDDAKGTIKSVVLRSQVTQT